MSVSDDLRTLVSGERAPSAELRRAVAFLGWECDASSVRRRADGAGLAAGLGCGVAALFGGAATAAAALVALVAGALVTWSGRRLPRLLARYRRARALGAAGTVVSRLCLQMRLDPTVESASAFAARTGTGPLSRSLRRHVRRRDGRGGLTAFTDEWSPWFPALGRATALVVAAADADATDRDATLDRALRTVRDATRDRLADFAGEVRGPVSAVYTFGVLLPLALVGLLPAARLAGAHLTAVHVAVVYDVLLPVGLLVAAGWLFARRPVAFPPPDVTRRHPDVADWRWRAVVVGVVAGGLGWTIAGHVVAAWSAPVAASGFGLGVALAVDAYPITRVRDRVREVESGATDALALVGRRVAGGEAMEAALAAVARKLDGATGETLAAVAARQRRLGTDPNTALLGPESPLRRTPSPRVRTAAATLALASTVGAPAGETLTATATQLDELRRIEAETRRDLRRVTETLTNTAAVFGPLVAGATVALAARVAAEGSGPLGGGFEVPALGVAVGVYVLLAAVVLTVLATGLERGLDGPLLRYRVGLALPTATATYLAAVVGARLLVGV